VAKGEQQAALPSLGGSLECQPNDKHTTTFARATYRENMLSAFVTSTPWLLIRVQEVASAFVVMELELEWGSNTMLLQARSSLGLVVRVEETSKRRLS
jgi:hypothetical protein